MEVVSFMLTLPAPPMICLVVSSFFFCLYSSNGTSTNSCQAFLSVATFYSCLLILTMLVICVQFQFSFALRSPSISFVLWLPGNRHSSSTFNRIPQSLSYTASASFPQLLIDRNKWFLFLAYYFSSSVVRMNQWIHVCGLWVIVSVVLLGRLHLSSSVMCVSVVKSVEPRLVKQQWP